MADKSGAARGGAVKGRLTARKKALLAVAAGKADKAGEPVAFKVGELVDYTEYFVVMHGESTVQVQAMVEDLLKIIARAGGRVLGVEGRTENRWVVIDWGDVIIHIFLRELREFYELEKLWADAPRLKIPHSG